MSASTPILSEWMEVEIPIYYGSHVMVQSNGRDVTLLLGRILPGSKEVDEHGKSIATPVAGFTIPLAAAEEIARTIPDILRQIREAGDS